MSFSQLGDGVRMDGIVQLSLRLPARASLGHGRFVRAFDQLFDCVPTDGSARFTWLKYSIAALDSINDRPPLTQPR